MNIFVLDLSPRTAATYHCDKHVGKMILESAQLLCNAQHLLGGDPQKIPYEKTHINHRCSVWVRESVCNYYWLQELAMLLNDEYRLRFNKKVNHKSYEAILDLEWPGHLSFPATKEMTPFALCMPEAYRVAGDPVTSYRNYYRAEKRDIAKWTIREEPEWMKG